MGTLKTSLTYEFILTCITSGALSRHACRLNIFDASHGYTIRFDSSMVLYYGIHSDWLNVYYLLDYEELGLFAEKSRYLVKDV